MNKKQLNAYQTEKPFVCGGCKKKYGSYPAFYTHIKAKHEGIKPQGSKVPKMKLMRKGRPTNQNQQENKKKLSKLITKDFLLKYCDEYQIQAMKYNFIDNILIFLRELDSNNIAKVGIERVNIKNVWKELDNEIRQLSPNLFDENLEYNSIDNIFQEFLIYVSLDLTAQIIKELLVFFALLNNYVKQSGVLDEENLKEFVNIEWKQWKEKNQYLIEGFQVVGQQNYDLQNENVEFLVHFFLEYLSEVKEGQ